LILIAGVAVTWDAIANSVQLAFPVCAWRWALSRFFASFCSQKEITYLPDFKNERILD
jgi:hypothetical protein